MNTPCKPSSGAIPKKRSTQKQLRKDDDQEQTDAGSETRVSVTEDFSISQLPVSELDTTIGEKGEKLQENDELQSLNYEFPPQSLPPSEDNAIEDVANRNMDQYSKEFNRLLLNIKSQKLSSCPSRPNSPEEVSPLPGLLSRSTADVCHVEESTGCPAENDEVKRIIL